MLAVLLLAAVGILLESERALRSVPEQQGLRGMERQHLQELDISGFGWTRGTTRVGFQWHLVGQGHHQIGISVALGGQGAPPEWDFSGDWRGRGTHYLRKDI